MILSSLVFKKFLLYLLIFFQLMFISCVSETGHLLKNNTKYSMYFGKPLSSYSNTRFKKLYINYNELGIYKNKSDNSNFYIPTYNNILEYYMFHIFKRDNKYYLSWYAEDKKPGEVFEIKKILPNYSNVADYSIFYYGFGKGKKCLKQGTIATAYLKKPYILFRLIGGEGICYGDYYGGTKFEILVSDNFTKEVVKELIEIVTGPAPLRVIRGTSIEKVILREIAKNSNYPDIKIIKVLNLENISFNYLKENLDKRNNLLKRYIPKENIKDLCSILDNNYGRKKIVTNFNEEIISKIGPFDRNKYIPLLLTDNYCFPSIILLVPIKKRFVKKERIFWRFNSIFDPTEKEKVKIYETYEEKFIDKKYQNILLSLINKLGYRPDKKDFVTYIKTKFPSDLIDTKEIVLKRVPIKRKKEVKNSVYCDNLENKCLSYCKNKNKDNGDFFNPSDFSKCKMSCDLSKNVCYKGDKEGAKIYACQGMCAGLKRNSSFLIFNISDFDECVTKCKYKLKELGF